MRQRIAEWAESGYFDRAQLLTGACGRASNDLAGSVVVSENSHLEYTVGQDISDTFVLATILLKIVTVRTALLGT